MNDNKKMMREESDPKLSREKIAMNECYILTLFITSTCGTRRQNESLSPIASSHGVLILYTPYMADKCNPN